MDLYLDIIWLLNILFNSLLLFLTGIVLKRKISKLRIFLGGFLGSLIVFLPFFAAALLSPFVKVATSIIMVGSAFGYKRFRYFMTNLFMFYIITFSTGGALIGLHYLFQFNPDYFSSLFLTGIKGFGEPISWIFVLIGFPFVLLYSEKSFSHLETVKIRDNQLAEVILFLNKNNVHLAGLVDSGNLLYDPLSKKPVMIVSLKKTSHLFPKEILAVFEDVNELSELAKDISTEWANKLSVIPYRGIGQEQKLIAAVKPEKIIVKRDGEIYETDKVLLAFVTQTLSSEDTFDCIIHPKIINGSYSKEVS